MRSEANPDEAELLERARSAAKAAYAPYSNFRVGAAVITDVGIFTGCNVENTSYGLSMCAERNAIFAAAAAGARIIRSVAVSCIDAKPELGLSGRMPCGACRQVIVEFADRNSEVSVVVDGAGVWTVEELLPESFRLG